MAESDTHDGEATLPSYDGITIERLTPAPTSAALYKALEYAEAKGTAQHLDHGSERITGYMATAETTGTVGFGPTVEAALVDLATRLVETADA